MEADDKLNEAANMEFSDIKEDPDFSHVEDERKNNTSSPVATDDWMDFGSEGHGNMYQQSEMIFTQSID